jgi:hypothetical protein
MPHVTQILNLVRAPDFVSSRYNGYDSERGAYYGNRRNW